MPVPWLSPCREPMQEPPYGAWFLTSAKWGVLPHPRREYFTFMNSWRPPRSLLAPMPQRLRSTFRPPYILFHVSTVARDPFLSSPLLPSPPLVLAGSHRGPGQEECPPAPSLHSYLHRAPALSTSSPTCVPPSLPPLSTLSIGLIHIASSATYRSGFPMSVPILLAQNPSIYGPPVPCPCPHPVAETLPVFCSYESI